MIVNKALIAAAVLLFTAPVAPTLAHDDYGDHVEHWRLHRDLSEAHRRAHEEASTATQNTKPITVPYETCTKTSMRIIRETDMITTGGVAPTAAGGTVGADPEGGVLRPHLPTTRLSLASCVGLQDPFAVHGRRSPASAKPPAGRSIHSHRQGFAQDFHGAGLFEPVCAGYQMLEQRVDLAFPL